MSTNKTDELKFICFADIHHAPEAFMSNAEEKLDKIQARAVKENVDFIIHVGDLCHGAEQVPEFVERYTNFSIPSYNCLGNHDSDNTCYEKTLEHYKMENGYYYFDKNGNIIIDNMEILYEN